MKETELTSLLEKFTVEGKINIVELNKEINTTHIDGIINNKKEKWLEELKPQAVNDFIGGLGIEEVKDVDSFNLYTKKLNGNATEHTQLIDKLTKENSGFKTDLDDVSGKYNTLNKEITNVRNENAIASSNFNMKYKNAIIAEANTRMNDDVDFAGALGLVKTDFPEYLVTTSAGGATPAGDNTNNDDEWIQEQRKKAGLFKK